MSDKHYTNITEKMEIDHPIACGQGVFTVIGQPVLAEMVRNSGLLSHLLA